MTRPISVYAPPIHNPRRPLPRSQIIDVEHGGPKATRVIAVGSDDAGEGAGVPELTATSHQLLDPNLYAGLRFTNIPVYQGHKIVRAYIEVTLADNDKNDAEGTWFCHDIDDSPTFTTTDGDVDGRTKTTASVSWTTNDLGVSGTRVRTPDLTPILQEVVDRPGWQPGNAVSFLYQHLSNTDKLVFACLEHATLAEPSLYIEYLPAVPGHWRENEDQWVTYATTSEDNRAFKTGDAGAAIYIPGDDESLWSHADTAIGTVNAAGFVTINGIVKNSVNRRNRKGEFLGQIYHGPGIEPAWRHPDHGAGDGPGFTVMDMVFDGSGQTKSDVIAIGWSEPTTFGTANREGLILTLTSTGAAGTYTTYSINNGLFFVTSCYLDAAAGFHYILGIEFVFGPNQAFRTHEVQRYIRLARAAVGNLTNSANWEYWTGSTWSSTQSNAVRLTDSRGYEIEGYPDITRRDDGYYLAAMSTEREVVKLYKASAASGPWTPYAYFDLPHRRPLAGGNPPANSSFWSGFPKFQEWLDPGSRTIALTHSFGVSAHFPFEVAIDPPHVSQGIPNVLLLPLDNVTFPDLMDRAIEWEFPQAIISGQLFSGTVDAVAEIVGAIDVVAGGAQVTFAGNVDAVADITGDIVRVRTMAAQVDAVADVAGDVVRTRDFAGTVDAVGEVVGSIVRARDFAGSVDAIAELVGDIQIQGQVTFAAAVEAVAELAGAINIAKTYAGAIEAVAELAGDIVRVRTYTGDVSAIADIAAELTVTGALTYTVDFTVTVGISRSRAQFEVVASRERPLTTIGATREGTLTGTSRTRATADVVTTRTRDFATVTPTRGRGQAEVGATRQGTNVGPSRVERLP